MPKTACLSCLVCVATVAWLGGCGAPQQEPEKITVLCGGSFRLPMEKLKELFERETGCEAELAFGQSEDHLPKVKTHTGGDVFVSHDPYVADTEKFNAMLRYVEVGYVAPALVVKKGNPLGIKGIDDLAKPGVRVVLMNPEYATCGKMTFALLEKKGIKEAVLANVGNDVVREHTAVATHIKLGHRDAGIMWNGMTSNFRDDIEVVPTPYEYDEEIRVAVIGLSYSKKRDLVEKFLKFVEAHGKQVFSEFGYVKTVEGAGPAPKDVQPPQRAGSAAQGPLTLFCGAGIRPAAAEAIEAFSAQQRIKVECDYAGSEMLLSRIKLTHQGDLYMPGDTYYLELAEKEGLIAGKQTVCYFVPVILVQKGNPKNIRALSDLTRPGIKVGLGDPKACAVGRTSSEIFAKNSIAEEEVNRNVEFRSLTVNELGNHVKLKTLDAVIVWDAIAAYYADSGEVVPIPPAQNVVTTVAVAVLKCSRQPELAGNLAEFFASDAGKAIFAKHHYSIKPPR